MFFSRRAFPIATAWRTKPSSRGCGARTPVMPTYLEISGRRIIPGQVFIVIHVIKKILIITSVNNNFYTIMY